MAGATARRSAYTERLANRGEMFRITLLLLGVFGVPLCGGTLGVAGQRFVMDSKPFKMWGIRVASASQDERLTEHLIAQLDDYAWHGVNSVSVYYMGSSAGFGDPFSPGGGAIDPAHQRRMTRIIEECGRRGMTVIAGIFYQRSSPPKLKDWDAARNAVRTVARALKPYRNVIINIANEQNSKNYRGLPWERVMDPQSLLELCRLVKAEDPGRIVGAGGYDHANNLIIGKSAAVDALLFDTSGPEDSGELYRRFVAGGVNKPIVNVETFGGWTNNFLPQGAFPEEVKAEYLREVKAAADHPGLSVHFHNTPWCQAFRNGETSRYDLAGDGTAASPGIRWYFQAVQRAARGTGGERARVPLRFPVSEWPHRAPELLGFDPAKLEAGLAAIPHRGNIVVSRDGYLMARSGDIRDSSINIYSAAKSLTALVFARLLQLKKVDYEDKLPRSDYPADGLASFRQFLTMTSDYDLTPHQPGSHYAYNSAAVLFYGEYMRLRFFPGLSAPETLKNALFDWIGHEDPISVSTRAGVHGSPWAGGPRISARDMARVGLLVLARGKWGGEQIVPAEFCDALFQGQIPAAATPSSSGGSQTPNESRSESNQRHITRFMKERYSYGWWSNEDGHLGEGLPREIAYAAGRGGNHIFVVRPWRIVIAVTNDVPDEETRPPVAAYIRAVAGAARPGALQ